MARIGDQLTENTERRVRRHAVAEQWMRGDARESKLSDGTGGKGGNLLEPGTDFGVMLMILPEQGHEDIDVEQAGHGVRLSIS